MRNNLSRSLQGAIIFLMVVGIIALALGGYFGPVSNELGRSLTAVQAWISVRFLAIQDFFTAPRDLTALRQRNSELESEVSRLQTQLIELQQKVADRETLAALVDFSRANPQSTYQGAAVIGHDPSPFLHYVIIDVGSSDGIRRGMPVVTNQGLVGRVDAVISNAARVQLITDPASTINVRLQNTETEAMLNGSISGDLTLDLISQDARITSGDVVLTSGLGGGYPADLLVGQVLNVRKSETALFQQATVQSIVDFSRLEIVLVIVDFRAIDISPLIP